MQTQTHNESRVLYVIEDANGTIYTAHRDKAQAMDDGEEMVTFAKENGMSADFYLQPYPLQ